MDDVAAEIGSTPPSVCGLAIALPASRNDIAEALSGGRYSDYVGRGASAGNADRLWQSAFGPVAEAVEDLITSAGARGVRIANHATLAGVGALFECCRVVTLIGHWRGPEIGADDVVEEVSRLVARLAREPSEFADRVRRGLPPEWWKPIERAATDQIQRSRLAEVLDIRLSLQPALIDLGNVQWRVDERTLRHINRDGLDAAWPGTLRPGNRLELADGQHTAVDIATVVPAAWSGIADLSNCHSVQISQRIKLGRSDRLVIANEMQTDPLLRLPMLGLVYELLAKGGRNYLDARLALARELGSMLP